MIDPSLRDVFACCALLGLASQHSSPEDKAEIAYALADAMLNEREKGEEGIVAIKRKPNERKHRS